MQHTARRRGRPRECALRSELGEGPRLWLAWAWAWARARVLKMQAVAGRVGHGQWEARAWFGFGLHGRGLLGQVWAAWHVWTESGWTLQGIAHWQKVGEPQKPSPKPQADLRDWHGPRSATSPPGRRPPPRLPSFFALPRQPWLVLGASWPVRARCSRATTRWGPISTRRLVTFRPVRPASPVNAAANSRGLRTCEAGQRRPVIRRSRKGKCARSWFRAPTLETHYSSSPPSRRIP